MAGDTISILVADDYVLVREGLRAVLEEVKAALHGLKDIELRVLECASLDEAVRIAADTKDLALVILGLDTPGMNGAQGIAAFHERFPAVSIVANSGHYQASEVLACFRGGAMGFLGRSLRGSALGNVILLILEGERYVPPDLVLCPSTGTPRAAAAPTEQGSGETSALRGLSTREREVLDELVKGHSNKVIAATLDIQEVTVKLHLRRIFEKLGVANRVQAARIALGYGPGD